jgi:hypothetical protein
LIAAVLSLVVLARPLALAMNPDSNIAAGATKQDKPSASAAIRLSLKPLFIGLPEKSTASNHIAQTAGKPDHSCPSQTSTSGCSQSIEAGSSVITLPSSNLAVACSVPDSAISNWI